MKENEVTKRDYREWWKENNEREWEERKRLEINWEERMRREKTMKENERN